MKSTVGGEMWVRIKPLYGCCAAAVGAKIRQTEEQFLPTARQAECPVERRQLTFRAALAVCVNLALHQYPMPQALLFVLKLPIEGLEEIQHGRHIR